MSIYARFGLLVDAQNVFDTSPFGCLSNLLLWNSILRANVSHGYYENALQLYVKMRRLGVLADGFTFPLVIRACGFLASSSSGKIVHSHILQMGFQHHLHVVNELLGMYAKLGHPHDALYLFDRMTVRSYISWNTMVSGFSLNLDCDGAFEMFKRMELEGLEPNQVTWTSLLSGHSRCGRYGCVIELFDMMKMRGFRASAEVLAVLLSVCDNLAALDRGRMVHGCVIKSGFEDYLFVKNALICLYGKYGDVANAKVLFSEMRNKNVVSWNALITSYVETGFCDEALEIFSELEKSNGSSMEGPNMISWSAIISGYASQGRGEESLQHFRRMQLAQVMANCVTISSVLSVCAELAALNLGKEIHCHLLRAFMDNNILVGNGLLNMYMRCGSLQEGQIIFEKIDNKDLISWNSLITGYGMHGQGERALTIFNEMVEAGFHPDGVTFVAVLSACSHTGLVAKGRRLFDLMTRVFGIEPQMEHYACIVDVLGRAGFLQEAIDIVKGMPMEPNACVWGALLNSCRMHKNTEVAEGAASRLFRLDSKQSGSHMLLSNIYAESGRWEDSARVRSLVKTKGLKKVGGHSWIQVKKKVYVFSAGQTGLEEIHGILQELGGVMESEGFRSGEWSFKKNVDAEEWRLILWAE